MTNKSLQVYKNNPIKYQSRPFSTHLLSFIALRILLSSDKSHHTDNLTVKTHLFSINKKQFCTSIL